MTRLEIEQKEVTAVDFETYYDDEYSVRRMDAVTYCRHPKFDPYLVAIRSKSGKRYVGDPRTFDWTCLNGAHLIAHNAGFDGMVIRRMIELGWIPNFQATLDCTADMVAFFNLGKRSLAAACQTFLGKTISKQVRSDMLGRTFASLTPEERIGLLEYADDDAIHCLELWDKLAGSWPEFERRVSRVNREAVWYGIYTDRAAVEAGFIKLCQVRDEATSQLPWMLDQEEYRAKGTKGKPGAAPTPLSTHALSVYCKRVGLTPPSSFNKNDPAMKAWVEANRSEHPFIDARIVTASINGHINRMKAMLDRADADGILHADQLYFGTHTGRASGRAGEGLGDQASKFNLLNLPKGDKQGLTHGVDMRGMLRPRPGCLYAVYDYGQIEPRVTHFFAKHMTFLNMAAKENIYQAAAKIMGWYSGNSLKKDNTKMYQLAKSCTIGLGYRMSAGRFMQTTERDGLDIDPAEWDGSPDTLDRRLKFILLNVAKIDYRKPEKADKVRRFLAHDKIVTEWRAKNSAVVDLWKALETQVETSANLGKAFHAFRLPSGRIKKFFNPHFELKLSSNIDPETGEVTQVARKTLFAKCEILGTNVAYHGGSLLENLVQAFSRDIIWAGILAVVDKYPHWRYEFNVYDEAVFEIPAADAELAKREIPRLLCANETVLQWAPGLPLEVEGGVYEKYQK